MQAVTIIVLSHWNCDILHHLKDLPQISAIESRGQEQHVIESDNYVGEHTENNVVTLLLEQGS